MRRVVTESSEWLIDQETSTYRRTPRDPSRLRHTDSHRLVDDEWLPYALIEPVVDAFGPRLRIVAPDATLGVFTGVIVEDSEA